MHLGSDFAMTMSCPTSSGYNVTAVHKPWINAQQSGSVPKILVM